MTRIIPAALVTCAVLAAPSASQAATDFGSRLNHDPANSGECEALLAPCTLASYIHPSDPNGDPYAGGAPVDGVITRFRIRAFGIDKPATVTFRLATVTRPDPAKPDVALAQAAGTGPTVTIPAYDGGGGDIPIREYDGRVPVKKGDHLAIDGTNVAATYNASGDKFTYKFDQALVEGQAARASNAATGELLVAARIEPDADRDGFGDQTQDGCSTQAATQGACVPGANDPGPNGTNKDTTKPRVKGLKVIGGKLQYRLSERANVTVRIKKGGRTVKKLTAKGVAGKNRISLKRRSLSNGRYKVVVNAKDLSGNKASIKRIGFRVNR